MTDFDTAARAERAVMDKPIIIGLSGYARSGKGEVAKRLVEEHGFMEFAFADALRSLLIDLNPVLDIYRSNARLVDVLVEHDGWEGVKGSPWAGEVRYQLQYVGTTMRQHFGDGIWTSALVRRLPMDNTNVVISDVRYEGEGQAIKSLRGSVWRIERSGTGPINDHHSESGMDWWPFDEVLHNGGTLDDLHALVDRKVKAYA